ncbi:histone-like nucleoid-structuring protein Lsr2 [Nocardia thailandica]
MARKVTVKLIDDLDNTSVAAQTITFGIDGAHYEIDLSDTNAAKLSDEYAQWIAHARRTGRAPKNVMRSCPTAGTAAPRTRNDLTAIRTWATENGHKVSKRGRIAAEIIDAYNEATA